MVSDQLTDTTDPSALAAARGNVLAESARRWASAVGASARLAVPAMVGYALVRAFGLVVLYLWARSVHVDFWRLLTRFDASGYSGIAAHGYDKVISFGPDGQPITTNLAYFPLFPGLIRVVSAVLPVSYATAGLIIAWVAGLVAAWGIFTVGNHLYGRRAGIVLAILWGVLPHSLIQQLGITETLFTAIAAWALYALLTRRWLTAGLLCLVAGLTRPTALALVAAIGLAAVVALWRRESTWWRPVLATAIAPLGWLAFIVWVGVRLRRVDGWFYVQGTIWHSSFDAGRYTLGKVKQTLLGKAGPLQIVFVVVTFVLVMTIVLLVLGVMDRQPWPLLLYSVLLLVMTAGGTGYYHTTPRHLVPAFTLLLPIAAAADRIRRRNLVATIVVLALASAWYGGYLALIGRWSY